MLCHMKSNSINKVNHLSPFQVHNQIEICKELNLSWE